MSDKQVSKNDLEKAFEDFFGETLPNESDASSLLIIGATFLVAAVIFGSFISGKRSGRLLSTVVEIKRS